MVSEYLCCISFPLFFSSFRTAVTYNIREVKKQKKGKARGRGYITVEDNGFINNKRQTLTPDDKREASRPYQSYDWRPPAPFSSSCNHLPNGKEFHYHLTHCKSPVNGKFFDLPQSTAQCTSIALCQDDRHEHRRCTLSKSSDEVQKGACPTKRIWTGLR